MATKPDYNVPNKPAIFTLENELTNTKIVIPCTPHTFSIKQNPKNESDSLVDGRPITRAKLMNAQTFTIEFRLPFYEELNVCFPGEWHERKYYTDWFWYMEENRDYYTLTIEYPNGEDWTGHGILDSWDYTQSAEKGSDWDFTLTFTERYQRKNIESRYVLQNPYVRMGNRDYRRVS